MVRRVAPVLAGLLLGINAAAAQQSSAPTPLYPRAVPPSVEQQTLPPPPSAGPTMGPGDAATPATAAPPAPAASATPMNLADRVFCQQPVSVGVVDRDAVPERYRDFVGMFSDAAWSSALCAALVVENIGPDGTATIVYAFGPMGADARTAGGVLHGTGIIHNGELRFQNSDGSQFAFRPLYDDLDGRLTSPQGQSYQAIFKRTP